MHQRFGRKACNESYGCSIARSHGRKNSRDKRMARHAPVVRGAVVRRRRARPSRKLQKSTSGITDPKSYSGCGQGVDGLLTRRETLGEKMPRSWAEPVNSQFGSSEGPEEVPLSTEDVSDLPKPRPSRKDEERRV
jgi:hypothetical protein